MQEGAFAGEERFFYWGRRTGEVWGQDGPFRRDQTEMPITRPQVALGGNWCMAVGLSIEGIFASVGTWGTPPPPPPWREAAFHSKKQLSLGPPESLASSTAP